MGLGPERLPCCHSCRWRVYAPRDGDEVLRRDCSPDYSQEDIGEPVLEVELQPGVSRVYSMYMV